MANPVLDLSIYTPTELQTLLTSAKQEYALRLTTGRVRQGASAAQSYGLDTMSTPDLIRLMNGISDALGLSQINARVQPNFNTCGNGWPATDALTQ